ncbi:hypothetical protein RhiJN_10299 [Ceratobasidium sp. AG-Ba]|nr:hypothetical protein RhiJN_10299 [Ceratobasidium sp. AG-Ba]
MRQTRSRATGAKPGDPANVGSVEGAPSPGVEDENTNEKHQSDFEDDEQFEHKEASGSKRKRVQPAQSTKLAPRKKQVRRKQGRLEGLMKMPSDIFIEIALYLMPKDIISLARSNKFFRKLLMSRTALHIWLGTMRNVPGIPPCPPDLSEPHYLALIYARNCSICGMAATRRMDELLRVRLCQSCRATNLVKFTSVLHEARFLVPYSSRIMPSKRRRGDLYMLKSEFQEAQARLDSFKQSGDTAAMEEWKASRKNQLEIRRAQAQELMTFLDGLEEDRGSELADLKAQHRLAVRKRLLESGWEEQDLIIHYTRRQQWHVLVDQPKVLTDRTWTNLQPKLISVIEANREDRLEREKEERKRARRTKFDVYLKSINEAREPIIDVQIPFLEIPGSTFHSSSNTHPSTVQIKHMGIFPRTSDARRWDEVKGLLEEDRTVEEMEQQFNLHRPEIIRHANKWVDDIQDHLVELLRKAREEDGLSRDIPPALAVAPGDSPDLLETKTLNLKILLRADSLFESGRLDQHLPVVYDAAVSNGYPPAHRFLYGPPLGPELGLDVTKIKRHIKAQQAARMLLECIGKPNAAFLEMKAVGRVYRCGRCHERTSYTWEGIVHHFVSEQLTWDQVQPERSKLNEQGIAFRNVHDPAVVADKPIIKLMASPSSGLQGPDSVASLKSCKLCSKTAGLPLVRASEEEIIEHLYDVHAVSSPTSPEHYGPAFNLFNNLLDDYPVDDYEDPVAWGQHYNWSDDDMSDIFW